MAKPAGLPVYNISMQWGAYAGPDNDLDGFEALVGKKVDYQAIFVGWKNDNQFPKAVATKLKNKNNTLVIFWESMDDTLVSADQPEFSYDAILNGKWDYYIKSFADAAAIYGDPVVLVPFEEMNGDWYAWSGTKNSNTPLKHILAYRYLKDKFNGVKNVKFGWAVNHLSVPDIRGNQISDYYPGDDFVDIVGVDGFNFGGPWMSFKEIFDDSLTTLSTYDKPIIIFSTASAEGAKKASWISQGLGRDVKKYPKVIGWIWFNENKEKDWRINSDADSLAAFQSATP